MKLGIDILDRLYDGLKFKDAEYKEKTNTCIMYFLYNPEQFKLTDEIKRNILTKIEDIVGNFVKYELDFISCALDKRAIANHTYTTIVNNFPALSKNFTYDDVSVDIQSMKVYIKLKLSPSNYDYAKSLNREQLVAEKLSNSFLADFQVEFVKKEDEIQSVDAIKNNMELLSSIKEAEEKTVYELSDITNIIGKNEYSLAIDFSKVTTPIENAVICGNVLSCTRKTYTRKQTKNGETKEIERSYYTIALKNDNHTIYCSLFPNQHDEQKGDLIEEGMPVCCYGSFKEFNHKIGFTANSIARCIFKKEEIKSGYKHVNEMYHTVFPTEYECLEQADMFAVEGKPFSGEYVVFDTETTGLDSSKDEIIEIGACKIVDGKITEVFSTFVKPSKKIPAEITNLTGITDEMVKDAPTINYVLPDFYKFCYGATIVAHNLAFDMGFVQNVAKRFSFNFNNNTMDTLEMAKKKIGGLKNYKLGTIVEHLGVELENAHRAVNDATATAKVFIKLMQNYWFI